MREFRDKVVVITGGATGIGFAFARAFAAEGAKIVISGLRGNRLRDSAGALAESGADVKSHVGDVSKLEDVEALADFAWNAYGHVDVIMNNAGVMVQHNSVIDMPIEDIQNIFAVNFFGVLYGCKVFGKRFIEQGTPAAIYNLGSENSLFHGTPYNGAYVATKHSVLAITHSLYEELPSFIDVSLICPGFVVSELGPEENMKYGMATDKFIGIAMEQLKANEFFVVSHAYNMERIDDRHKMLSKAYATYAPRYAGDQEYDVRTIIGPMLQEQMGRPLREF
jgi:NAD(P)-dependent dehydrogenase (short-subunit alcohol dehydrogenase family)